MSYDLVPNPTLLSQDTLITTLDAYQVVRPWPWQRWLARWRARLTG